MEIGPGRGALTRPLLESGVRVIAFEVDARLAENLRAKLGQSGLFLEHADALKVDVAKALERAGVAPPVALVGSLPYESATPMLRAFVRRPDLYSRLVAMVQREVADRLVARPGTAAYGFLTLDVGAHGEVKRLFNVGSGDFDPPPKVLSSVVELVPHRSNAGDVEALKVASQGFSSRRKTLVNGLTPLWGRPAAMGAVEAAGLSPSVRAETLGLPEFRRLAVLLGPPGPPGAAARRSV